MADKMNEPDWSDSKTLLSECWKNPLHPMSDRLLMADGAVAFRDAVISNLRKRLKAAHESNKVLDTKVAWMFETGKKLSRNPQLSQQQKDVLEGFIDAMQEAFNSGEIL